MGGDEAAEREAEKQRVAARLQAMEEERERQGRAQEEQDLHQRRQRLRQEKERVLERLAEKKAKDAEAKEAEQRRKQLEQQKHREEHRAEKARFEKRLSRMAAAASPKPEPEPEPEPPTEATASFLYLCTVLKTASLRKGFDMSSQQVGVLAVGEQVVILEERQNDLGQTRVRCSRGWSSLATCDGTPLLKNIPASSVSNAAQAAITSLVDHTAAGWGEAEGLAKKVCALEQQLSEEQKRLAVSKAEGDELRQQLAVSAQDLSSAEAERDELRQQLAVSAQDLSSAEAEHDELRQQLAVSAQDLSSAEVARATEASDATLRLSQKDAELARAHTELQSARREAKTLAAQVDFCRNELSAERERRSEAMEQATVLQKKLQVEQIAHHDADDMVKELSHQKDLLSEAKETDAARHDEHVKATETEKQALRTELAESQIKMQALQTDLAESKAALASITQKLDASEAHLTSNASELASVREKHAACESQRHATLEVLRSTETERDEILVERQQFQTELNAAQKQFEELKAQHEASQTDAELAAAMIEKLTSQCESQKEQLVAAAAAEDAAAAAHEALVARLQHCAENQVATTPTNDEMIRVDSPLDEPQHASSQSPRPQGVQQLKEQDSEKVLVDAKLEIKTLQERLAAAEQAGAMYASEAQTAMQSNLSTTSQELNILDDMTQELAQVRAHHVERSRQVSTTLQLLATCEDEKAQAKNQAEELEATIKSLQEELHHANATAGAANEQVSALEGSLVTESQRATELAKQVDATSQKAEQQERLRMHLQQAYDAMKADNDSLSEQLKVAQDQSHETESIVVRLRAELSAANACREEEHSRYVAVNAQLAEAGDQLTEVADSTKKLHEEAVAALQAELVEARGQLAAAEAVGAGYAEQVTTHKEAAEKTRAEVAELTNKNAGLQREVAKLTDTERAAQERCTALFVRLSQAEAEAEAQLASSNEQISRLQSDALAREESRQNEIQQRIAGTREEMLAEFEQQRAEERAQLAQLEGSELAKVEARLAFAEHTAAAAGSNGAAIQAQLSRSQAELLDANRLMARLKEQCEAWANENASHRARHQRKVFGLQAGLAGLNAGVLRLKCVRMAFLHWKRSWSLSETSESLGLQLAVLHGQKGKFKAINTAFATWKTSWSAGIQLQARTNRSVRGWQWRRTLATWQRWKLYLHLKANKGVFNPAMAESSSPKLSASPHRVGTMVNKKLTDHALTLEQQLAEETARADLGTEIAEIERAAREQIETERDATVASALERVAEVEKALATERQRSGREFQGARDGLQQQLHSVMEASSAEIEEAHATARKTKAHAERRVAAAEKEATRFKDELREVRLELAATRKKVGSADPEKLKKDLRRARNDAHKLRESLNAAEQANVLLEQQKAALEKRVRNLVKTTRTPRQRLRSAAAAPVDLQGSPVAKEAASGRSGAASRSGPLVISPPPSELLHPEKTHAWGKAPSTGRESPLRSTSRTASVGSYQVAQGHVSRSGHAHGYSHGASNTHTAANTGMEQENASPQPELSLPLVETSLIPGGTAPATAPMGLGETPISTPQRPSRRAREPGRSSNRGSAPNNNVEAPSAMSLSLSVAQQEQGRLLDAAAQSKPHTPSGS